MFDKLEAVDERFQTLGHLLSQHEVVSNPTLLQRYGQERSDLEELVGTYRAYRDAEASTKTYETVLDEGKLEPEYLELVSPDTLAPLARVDGHPILALIAARMGTTRLIDNELIQPLSTAKAAGANDIQPLSTAKAAGSTDQRSP